jgi:prepilin-type processing-associated H-X9-DG protein
MYLEYESKYPLGRCAITWENAWIRLSKYWSVPYTIDPTVRGPKVLLCPDDTVGPTQPYPRNHSYGPALAADGTSFTAGYGFWEWTSGAVRRQSEVTNPAETAYAMDADWDYVYIISAPVGWYSDPGYPAGVSYRRHGDGVNIVFCDGHVSWRKWPLPSGIGLVRR